MVRHLTIFGAALLMLAAAPAAAQVAIGNREQWVGVQDYPPDALKHHDEGMVNLSFKINADGTVSGCKIIYATAPASLRKQSCARILERAHYRPARNEAGAPIQAEDQLIVRWQAAPADVEVESQFGGAIPLSSPPQWATDNDFASVTEGRGEADVDMRFTIGADGRIVDCTASAGVTAHGPVPCWPPGRAFASRAASMVNRCPPRGTS